MPVWMNSNQLRKKFLAYFESHDHRIVPSSPLIPAEDPTLLFTNAGMVQFKDAFLGHVTLPYRRAASAQLCVRAGGKHNDLENVGYTRRHHTFFEMLGNFSFGDYFKREAIRFAWDFLTKALQLPPEKLWITVFRDDKESEAIWFDEIGIDQTRFSRCGEKDNFWSMGETGPCGPCTEIFYDHGPEVEGGPPGSAKADGDRYVEIWNLVFMQYDRNIHGELTPLPQPCVDTGMGLERIATVTQGVQDNYDIDLFQHLLEALSELVPCQDFQQTSMRVIVDHIRSVSFLIAEGVTPSNEGRGYVLRRIIRRAVRHGYKLGQHAPFFYKLAAALAEVMGEAYPELVRTLPLIEQLIHQEELQFANTLNRGLKVFDAEVAKLHGAQIPGAVVFQLYDTYGFPPDLTGDIARERGLSLDYEGFELAMSKQREQSQQAHQFHVDQTEHLHIPVSTVFEGYEKVTGEATVKTLLRENRPVSDLKEGEMGAVILDQTPFYAESGGQVGDSGYIYFETGNFRVHNTKKHGGAILHFGEVMKGFLRNEDAVRTEVDPSRKDIMLNHSATHLLHEALRRVLGDHVMQRGSLVEPKRLRFDFSHPRALTQDELQAVEHLVNQQIRENLSASVQTMRLDQAKQAGAIAFFDEKYEDEVRVVKMGDFSHEVCGGTHVASSGQIGLFKIISETACASGVRRIEALTGHYALQWVETLDAQWAQLGALLKTNREALFSKVEQLLAQQKAASREILQLKQRLAQTESNSILDSAQDVQGIKVVAATLGEVDRDTLRSTVDSIRQQYDRAAVILAAIEEGKVILVAGMTKNCLEYFNATALLNHVAAQVGGKGGGRPDLAQGGGDHPDQLPGALASVPSWVAEQVSAQ